MKTIIKLVLLGIIISVTMKYLDENEISVTDKISAAVGWIKEKITEIKEMPEYQHLFPEPSSGYLADSQVGASTSGLSPADRVPTAPVGIRPTGSISTPSTASTPNASRPKGSPKGTRNIARSLRTRSSIRISSSLRPDREAYSSEANNTNSHFTNESDENINSRKVSARENPDGYGLQALNVSTEEKPDKYNLQASDDLYAWVK